MLGYYPPAHLVRYKNEIAGDAVQMRQEDVDLRPHPVFTASESVIEVTKPYGEAIHNGHFRVRRQARENAAQFKRLFDRMKTAGPFETVF
jgi:hypothetical protein